ncbi:MAG: DUF1684 domain-containing protein [Pseudorhodobacter sp.]|nr:DUF1684 domain-containing protein [Pseudorhodobacter sp.]
MMDLSRWRADRLAALTAPDGWLNLTDRVEFATLPQTVGSAPDNGIRLSSGPAYLGRLLDGYRFETAQRIRAFEPRGNPMLEVAPFLLEIHAVATETALRVRDLTLPRTTTLTWFPPDPHWVIRARWEAVPPQPQAIEQKGAGPTTVTLTHRAHFTHQGHAVTLLATHWKSGQPMFVIRDQTSGHQTYAASRFLLGEDMTDSDITLDFNKAHNPPCAFTEFAICPLPPRQNILPFAVMAGELAP